MISPDVMAQAFACNLDRVKLQTNGLNQANSMLQLGFRVNCLNWLVDHLITNSPRVFKLLKVHDLPFIAFKLERYQRESAPISFEGEGVFPQNQLLDIVEKAQVLLADRLNKISAQELNQSLALFGDHSMSVAEWLFFYFHDSYHTGQTEILRQAARKDDKVF